MIRLHYYKVIEWRLTTSKERLVAFMDTVFAIIMTILILELKKPETATLKALWDLKIDFLHIRFHFSGLEQYG